MKNWFKVFASLVIIFTLVFIPLTAYAATSSSTRSSGTTSTRSSTSTTKSSTPSTSTSKSSTSTSTSKSTAPSTSTKSTAPSSSTSSSLVHPLNQQPVLQKVFLPLVGQQARLALVLLVQML